MRMKWFKQLLCRHDWEWWPYSGELFTLDGADRTCKKCGKDSVYRMYSIFENKMCMFAAIGWVSLFIFFFLLG